MLTNERTPIAALKSDSVSPDIYYIILDGYARSDVLEDLYAFDNSGFINYLQEEGFIVPSDNHSNYPKTSLSIPSTLNMNYIQTLAPGLEKSHFWWLMSPLINYSQTRVMLEKIGYETVSLSVDWTITNNKTTDIYYQPSFFQISEFENHLLHNTSLTLMRPLLDKIAYIPTSNSAHREMVLYNFERLAQIPELPGSKFIFAHILSPHPPFVFDKDGKNANSSKSFSFNDGEGFINGDDNFDTPKQRNEIYREGYIEQVQFINKRLKDIIDEILQNSDNHPIIIIQADHGPGLLTDFRSSDKTCLFERFSPFAAYYLPGIDRNAIPPDITPVNIFRIVFNKYFDTDLPLLENYYYFSKDAFFVYEMEDIPLQRIEAPCKIHP